MTAAVTPIGFAPIFPGWNVWSLYQATEPDNSLFGDLMSLGMSLDRQLQVWTENQIKEFAPGASVADPLNPAALRGDQIFIIPGSGTLKPLLNRKEQAPDLAGALHLGKPDTDGMAPLRFVRFYNRGVASVLPWPHDVNYVLETVFQPSITNPITNSPAPGSLAGTGSDIAAGLEHGLETLAWVAGGAAALLLILNLGKRS